MKTIQISAAALAVGVIGLGAIYWWTRPPASSTVAFTCPEIHKTTTGTAIKETPADMASVADALKGPEIENTIRTVAQDLRKKYPKAGDAEIANYLVGAYCPVIAKDNGLSDTEKRSRMDRFSSQTYEILKAK